MPQPSLIVVTGRPASGKTTLAHALARALPGPAICRDEIKEGIVTTSGGGSGGAAGDEAARQAYDAFFDTIRLLLDRRVTLVAEAAFQHKLWAPRLEPLREIARVRIVVCYVDAQLARSRELARAAANSQRERFHPVPATPMGKYDPPHLDVPTLIVDASDDYLPSFDQIVSFARG